MNLLDTLNTIARDNGQGPPVPVGHPSVGMFGFLEAGVGFKKTISSRSLRAIVRDDERGRLARFQNESRAFRELRCNPKSEATRRAFHAITSWDGILNARASGKFFDNFIAKLSYTTVASAWSSMFRAGGNPGIGTYPQNIPGGAVHDHLSVGAFPLVKPSGDTLYLSGIGWNSATGANVMLLLDLLVSSANISANTTSPQTITSGTPTRSYEGCQMTLEVTTALGATPANVTIGYTNSGGTPSRTTPAIAMTASAIAQRLQPNALGFQTQLQAGDTGVSSVETVTFSAAMGSGVVALNIFKPFFCIPSLVTTSFIERSTPASVAGLLPLITESGSGNDHPCLTGYVLSSTSSIGVQTISYQTIWG